MVFHVWELLMINALVEPLEEKEIGYSQYQFEGGDIDIVAEVQYQMAVESGAGSRDK